MFCFCGVFLVFLFAGIFEVFAKYPYFSMFFEPQNCDLRGVFVIYDLKQGAKYGYGLSDHQHVAPRFGEGARRAILRAVFCDFFFHFETVAI